ncbi:MAG: SUMF1/EgtB/PvdO family nonheme iron enzyme [Roseiarcus sp.]|jgi:formylglycine-generating enzyme required for sulfatase activity
MSAFRGAFVAVAAACLGLLGAAALRAAFETSRGDRVAVVTIEPGVFAYRLAGDFQRNGLVTNAPSSETRIAEPFAIMTTQVSQRDYAQCVVDGGCAKLKGGDGAAANLPVVGVNWGDATAYAVWLSRQTGEDWRLPSDVEWAYAAGGRFHDDAIPGSDGDGYAKRWLAKFDQEAARETQPKAPQPFGRFGANERGVVDLSGNVWEWTDACYERRSVDASGAPSETLTRNCRVRIAEGGHRAYISDFIRDSRTGGCSVGAPPTNLGIRLVRHRETPLRRALRVFAGLLASL